jgi:hypothetical protein
MEKFKKARVIMLPTETVKTSTILLDSIANHTVLTSSKLKGNPNWRKNGKPHHLYIISNDKIKEGDYYLFFKNNSICKAEFLTEENIEVLEGLRKIKAVQKIIAATDTLLIEDKRTYICGLMDKPNILPQPSQQFIEKYIESYNRGDVITDVLVEYVRLASVRGGILDLSKNPSWTQTTDSKCIESKLKVNSKDNTITIKKLKDSWNREELINTFKDCIEYCDSESGFRYDDFEYWVNENL